MDVYIFISMFQLWLLVVLLVGSMTLWHIPFVLCVCMCVRAFFFFPGTSLLFGIQDAPCTPSIFSSVILESASYPSCGSFSWRIILEIKSLVLGILIATGVSLTLDLLNWQSKEIRAHILTHIDINTHIYKYFYM